MNAGIFLCWPRAIAPMWQPRSRSASLLSRISGQGEAASAPAPARQAISRENRSKMNLIRTKIPEVVVLEPKVFGDERGFFLEIYNRKTFDEIGLGRNFVQDNHSRSAQHVLRGLHYQLGQPQGKLVRVLSGHIWDVAVDLRRNSPDFGKWAGFHLGAQSPDDDLQLLWIPEGFAHGFLVLSDTAEVLYKTTNLYYPAGERSILWNDRTLAIDWPVEALNGIPPSVSPKDALGKHFLEAELPPVEV